MEKALTHKEKLSKALTEIKANVTARDRKAAEQAFGYTRATISRYLNGQVNDIDTGTRLLQFFRKPISKRDKAIG
jgi:hypothetical protein